MPPTWSKYLIIEGWVGVLDLSDFLTLIKIIFALYWPNLLWGKEDWMVAKSPDFTFSSRSIKAQEKGRRPLFRHLDCMNQVKRWFIIWPKQKIFVGTCIKIWLTFLLGKPIRTQDLLHFAPCNNIFYRDSVMSVKYVNKLAPSFLCEFFQHVHVNPQWSSDVLPPPTCEVKQGVDTWTETTVL